MDQVQDAASGYIEIKSCYLFLNEGYCTMVDISPFPMSRDQNLQSRFWMRPDIFPHSRFHHDDQVIIDSLIGDGIGSTVPRSFKVS